MKKFTLLTLSALISIVLWASPRSLQQARIAARGMHHVYTAMQPNGQPAFYVFDRPNEGGYILISADDRAHTILGYTDKGHWDANDIPASTQAWLDMLADEMQNSHTDVLSEEEPTYTPVAPLCTTEWSQRSPYYNMCPMWEYNRCVTGCTATAASQIMKKHNYPEHGIGSHSYKWANENGDSVVLSADFENTTYDWSNMLDRYDNTATTKQMNAVSTLVYHCGVADELKYAASATNGNSHHMVQNMIEHFGYDKSVRTYLKDYSPDSLIMQEIVYNMQHGQPIYISAKAEDGTGHAFVCDGIDAEGLLHINWGWGGKSNGYYRLSAFAPQQQGTGGSATGKAFTQKIKLFTNIHPDANGEYYYSFFCDSIHALQPVYHRDSLVRFRVDTIYNGNFTEWKGHFRLHIYKDGAAYKRRTGKDYSKDLKAGSTRYKMTYSADFSNREDYPEGNYEIEFAVRVGEISESKKLYCKHIGIWKCQMTITTDSIYIVEPTAVIPDPEPTEAFEQVRQTPPAQKMMRDGVIYIRRNDATYNVQGIKVND